jgi:hypothetical protein
MTPGWIKWMIAGVVLAHLGAFYLVSGWNALPKAAYVPPPTFVAKETSWTDQATGETLTYREFQVSTKLAKLQQDAPKEK